MRRLSAGSITLLLFAAACSSGSGTPSTAPSTPASVPASTATTPATGGTTSTGLGRFYGQHLSWSDCDSGFQCSKLLVPIDYSKPDGATMDVAVIRLHSRGSHRGSLIVNPGGPGASGIDYVRNSSKTFSGVTENYDLVSFDPRGVGASKPIRCVTSSQLDAFVHLPPVPVTAAEKAATVNATRTFADDCYKRNGQYLEHVGTIDAARDMDVLRAALGDAKLTYYGASYGTYLGAKYAQLFPKRIRAMVLDGALDPSQPTAAENRVQAIGFETDLRDFLADCASRPDCPFGSTPAAAQQGLDQLRARITSHPLTVGHRSLGPGEFFEGLALGLYSTSYWPILRDALQSAENGDGTELLTFSDALTQRHADGSYSNLIESNLAINCIDRPSPTKVSDYVSEAEQFSKVAPDFGAAIAYSSMPCAFWHVPPVEQAHPVTAAGSPPIVVIGTTRDPATPYVWAQALARQLKNGVLVTFNSDGHTAYDHGNSCIVSAVNDYLNELTVPRDGLRCG